MLNKRDYSFIKKSLYPYRYWIIVEILNMFMWGVLRSMGMHMKQNIANACSGTNSKQEGLDIIIWYAFTYLPLLSIAWVLSHRLRDVIWRKVLPSLKKDITGKMMQRMMRHPHSFYQKNLTGRLGNRIKEMASRFPYLLFLCIDSFLSGVFTLIVVFTRVCKMGTPLAFILGGWVILFLASLRIIYPRLSRLNKNVVDTNNGIMGHILDVMNNLVSVRFFSGFKQEEKILTHKLSETKKTEQKRDLVMLFFYLIQGVFFLAVQIACFWFIVGQFKSGKVNVGDCLFVVEAVIIMASILWPWLKTVSNILDSWAYIKQGIRVVFAPLQEKSDALPLVVKKGEIVYDNVTFGYQEKKRILNRLSLKIAAGQHVALIGDSGEGKSTFINLLLRLYDIDQGSISIDGQNIAEVKQESLHEAISVVAQEAFLFQRSVMDNIRYSRHSASDEEVIEAAKSAYAHDFICALPQGYHTLVGERGASLSGGQRQRIAIARAFLKTTPILVMDEATSQLDPSTDLLIQRSLEALRQSRQQTTLVITHRPSTLLHVDRILVFERGKIVEDGTHEELLTAGGKYKEFWIKEKKTP